MAGSSQCFANTDSTAVSELACTHFLISGGVHWVNAHAVLLIQMEAQTQIFTSCSLTERLTYFAFPPTMWDFSSNEKRMNIMCKSYFYISL